MKRKNSTTVYSNNASKAGLNIENQERLEYRKNEVRNHVVDAQKQISSQETAGVFEEDQA